MPSAYQPSPCRRCGGPKNRPKQVHRTFWYCAPCEAEKRREYWRKHKPWWCGECASPYYCVTCARNKRDRMMLIVRNRTRPEGGYFRPFNAERWWQQRSHALVHAAIKRGLLPNLKAGGYACADCGKTALEYDHRDYGRPFDVEPVCRSCNKRRGTAIWPDATRFNFALIEGEGRADAA